MEYLVAFRNVKRCDCACPLRISCSKKHIAVDDTYKEGIAKCGVSKVAVILIHHLHHLLHQLCQLVRVRQAGLVDG